MVSQFSIPILWNLYLNQWEHKIKILVEDSDTGGTGSIAVRMEYLFAFQSWYIELCVENRWGGGRKHCNVIFCYLAVLLLTVDEG